jgi:hypothetical protein
MLYYSLDIIAFKIGLILTYYKNNTLTNQNQIESQKKAFRRKLMKSRILLSSVMVVLLLLSYVTVIAQDKAPTTEKWVNDPRTTGIYPAGNYTDLPQVIINEVPLRTSPIIVQGSNGLYMLNPNFRPHPTTTTTQSEVIVVRHPINQNIMFGSANTVWPPGGFSGISEGVYVTTNGGTSWYGWDSVFLTGHGGDPGPTIDKNGVFIISHLGYPTSGMFANYSTNNGVTWSTTYTIASGSQDKNFSGTDDAPTSPYYGRSYTVWSLFNVGSPPIAVSYTTNGGVSWTPAAQINTSVAGHYSQGCDIRVGPTGQVYVCWAAPVSGSPYTEDFAGFAKSTNGGVNWTVTNNAYDMNGIRGTFPTKNNIRVNGFTRIDVDRSGGPRNGWIYIVTAERNLAPAGTDPDVILHRSTDEGLTWSAGIRVNQDPLNNGKFQWFPAIRVDEYGGINIVYYDDRTVAANQGEVYLSRSIDGGNTWTDTEISDHLFTPTPIAGLAGGYQGDYIGITSGNNKVWSIWADNSTGIYQAWMTSFDLGPSIDHTPLLNTENVAGPYVVNCVINPAGSPIDPTKTRLFWSRNNVNITDSLLMTNTSGNNWTGNIPGNGLAATYRYYIKTADLMSRVATHPSGAPGVLHQFQASPDNIKPVIVHTPIPNTPKPAWPVTVNATITDNIGIDSGWVRWYRNNTGTGIKHFKLTNTGGSNYSAAFNSTQAEVNFNDSIFYRIIAQDNSSNHNKDSTALYSFKILAIANPCIGTGTTAVSWPYNTFWHDSKTQMLYTAAEITTGGGGAGSITKIGFNIISAAAQTMNQFSIKMQTTSATSITAFVTTGWTNVYTGTYTVPGTGWQFVTLQNPYAYNGTGNLLIEICFDNTSYTSATTVASSVVTNMCREQHTDNAAGCAFTAGTNVNRPNLCMEIMLPVGNQTIQTELPKEFSLSQNYPNPFNPTTSIKFAVPKQSLVKMVVYDVIGREVATLVNELKQPGNYAVPFDASSLASGVYFYRLEAGDFVDVKKMVLVK